MPKILGGSLTEHRERTRDALFGALAQLLRERGFDAISLADIAAQAGIGRTAVYNHFPDKESVLLGYIEHETSAYVAALERSLAGITDPVDQLREYVRHQLALERTYHLPPGPDLREVVSPDAAKRLRGHVRQVETVLRRILSGAIDAGAIPAQHLDAVVQLVHACLSGRSVPTTDPERGEFVAATELFVLRAVGARADGAVHAVAEPVTDVA
ncbi:TetR/AcrR family transcriptional regulator [Georgenia sp. TF02-10]|uniref:TetR/AcrR family transcriptional regulator n=1 Tax=Georgenia sp. TF02-10 TaxID=2917725 RepID=UPI001FA7D023|nr:TetR/AcrR family transcriptional regulator [Georgenia sp. TF02-10]UNX54689.1 TetR/AcrR family transcriptional regulator [Georgenia sp. TF02-10]